MPVLCQRCRVVRGGCEAARFGVLFCRTTTPKIITLKIIAQKIITAKIITTNPFVTKGGAVALIRVNCVHKKNRPCRQSRFHIY